MIDANPNPNPIPSPDPGPDPSPDPGPDPSAMPARRGRLWLRWLLVGLPAGLLVLFAAALAAGAWLWHSGPAQARLLQAVDGLSIEDMKGRVTGGAFATERLRWQGGDLTVEVDGLHWQDLSWRWRPHAGAWVGLTLEQPQARAVRIVRRPASTAPAGGPLQAPDSLHLPLALSVRGLKVGSVQLDGEELLAALAADVQLAADAGARHRIDHLSLSRGDLQLKGDLSIGTTGELPVALRLALATPAGQPTAWQASVQGRGPLRRLVLDADLRSEAGAALSAQATVTAFADWPLAALALQAKDLDLSTLAPGLPETRLSGSAGLDEVRAGQPLRVQLAVDNAKVGPWDHGRVPVRSARGTLQGRPSERDRLVFDGWTVGFGDAAQGGQLTLAGRWQGTRLDLEIRPQGMQAAQLDTRAPQATIDGTLTLSLEGLAVPGSAAGAAPRALGGKVQASLRGRLPAPAKGRRAPPPLALRGDIAFAMPADGSLQVELRGFEAVAGTARASATLDARRDVAGAWALKSAGELDRVDLADWWPAAGPSELNGEWQADLQLPAASPAGLLDALRGAAQLDLRGSELSGVAVSGTASLQAKAPGLALDAQVLAASNRLQLSARTFAAAAAPVAPAAKQGGQTWRAEIQAPDLAGLAPLLARLPGAKGWLPEAGALQGTAMASGNGPSLLSLRSEGRLQIDGLRLPQGRLDKASLRWTFNGLALDAPIELDAELSGLAQAERRIDRLHASLAGSLREHRLQLEADSPLRPPAWTDAAGKATAAATAAPGSALRLQAQGRWQPARSAPAAPAAMLGAGEWSGRVATLRAGPRAERGGIAEGQGPWLSARDVLARVTLDAQTRPTEARLEPGRIEAFGGVLAWQQAQWQASEKPGGAPRITLEAQLEPLKVAPVLARLQPDFGWGGDLVIGGRASVRSGARFDADIVIERQGGDLGLTLAGSRRDLGLTALRVALAAHDGRWQLSQALTGERIGVLGGSQKLQAGADAVWPPPDAPLEGGLSLQVGDAGIWDPWLPPGWRLGGAIAARVSLGGRLGAPSASGEVVGDKLLVRNIFEGIHLADGSLRVALDRGEAVVEKVRFVGGGGGVLDLRGRVSFAEAPQAELKLVLDKFRALDRVDRRVAISGDAALGLRAGRLSVLGRLGVDEGLIDVTAEDAPSLGADVVVVGRKDAQGRPLAVVDGGEAAKEGALAATDIDLRLALGDALRLRGRGLDTLLRGQLHITTTDQGALRVRGAVNTAEGTYTAYGQNLRIERGTVSFTGDVANPRLDILALRADIDNRVGVIVSGFAVDPRVRLYSDPDLPEVDQLTWLLTGEAPKGQGRDEAALLQRAALALLAGDRGASDEGFLQKLGIDQLGVARSDGGDTVVTIGKKLSKRLSIAYEKGLSAAGGTWALLYRIAGRTTLRARTGFENAVEVIWSWRWD